MVLNKLPYLIKQLLSRNTHLSISNKLSTGCAFQTLIDCMHVIQSNLGNTNLYKTRILFARLHSAVEAPANRNTNFL